MKQVEIIRPSPEQVRPTTNPNPSVEVYSPRLRRRRSWRDRASTVMRVYAVATAAVAAALGLQLAVSPMLGPDWPFLCLWPAVLFAAWNGGPGPGLFATALSALAADYLFFEPRYSFLLASVADGTGIGVYVALGIGISLLHVRNWRWHRQDNPGSRGDGLVLERRQDQPADLNGAAVSKHFQPKHERDDDEPAEVREPAKAEWPSNGTKWPESLAIELNRAESRDQVIAATVRYCNGQLQASSAMLFLPGEDGKSLLAHNGSPTKETLAQDTTAPAADAMRERRPVVMETLEEIHLRYPRLIPASQGAIVALPLSTTSVRGAIELRFAGTRRFNDHERHLLASMADVCGHAIGRTLALETERRARDGAERALTEQRHASSRLRTRLEHYRGLAELMPGIVWTAQPDGGYAYANQRWFDYTGLNTEQTQGDGWATALDPTERPQIVQRWRDLLKTGRPGELEVRLRGRDQRYRWFVIRAVPMRDARGEVARWIGSTTELNNADSSAADKKQAIRAEFRTQISDLIVRIIESCRFGVAIGDDRGGISYANPEFLQMLGYTLEDLADGSLRWDRVSLPDWLAADQQAAHELLQSGVCTPFEKEYRHKDGRRVPILMAAAHLASPPAAPGAIAGFYIDLSVLRRAASDWAGKGTDG